MHGNALDKLALTAASLLRLALYAHLAHTRVWHRVPHCCVRWSGSEAVGLCRQGRSHKAQAGAGDVLPAMLQSVCQDAMRVTFQLHAQVWSTVSFVPDSSGC